MRPQQLRLALPKSRFDLRTTVFTHGWVDLAPFRWDEAEGELHTPLLLADRVVDLGIRSGSGHLNLRIHTGGPVPRPEQGELKRQVRRMLNLDLQLAEFWKLCAPRAGGRAWIAKAGAGRLLRAPTLFEDLLKILFTTNCSWAATRGMCRNLVEALGPRSADGTRAFPSAQRCAAKSARFWRERVRVGYRAEAATELSRAFVRQGLEERLLALREDPAALRAELSELRGFGPYAVGQAMRLLGCFEELALDSWCRARLRQIHDLDKAPADAWVADRYRSFGTWSGLALWLDLIGEESLNPS